MRASIDKAGRVVIPKPLRVAAGLEPGMDLIVTMRDGVLEILPAPAEVLQRRRGPLVVAERVATDDDLDRATVEQTRRRLRDRCG